MAVDRTQLLHNKQPSALLTKQSGESESHIVYIHTILQ